MKSIIKFLLTFFVFYNLHFLLGVFYTEMVANGLTFVFWVITNVIFDDTNEVITTCVIWALVIFTLMYCILKTEKKISFIVLTAVLFILMSGIDGLLPMIFGGDILDYIFISGIIKYAILSSIIYKKINLDIHISMKKKEEKD